MGSVARVMRYEGFHAALVDAQRSRDYMPLENGQTPWWNTYEMMVMWKMVNMMRHSYDRPMIPFSEIEKVEQMASGHFDYTKKFALYASELVDRD